jgi:hypothetical protein
VDARLEHQVPEDDAEEGEDSDPAPSHSITPYSL